MAVKGSTEIKVGIFVFIGLLALFYLTFKLGEETFTPKETYKLYAIFNNVCGLTKGAKIEMAGVNIGKVGSIELTPNGKAKVELIIYKKYKIRKDAEAYIKTFGILGDKYVDITPGKAQGYLSPGAMIAKTHGPVSIEDVIASIKPALEDLKEILSSKEGKQSLKELVYNIKEISKNFRIITEKIEKGQGTLGKLINDDTLYKNLVASTKSIKDIAEKIDKGQGTIGKLINDDTLYKNLVASIKSLKYIGEKIEKGQGTFGKLLNDDTLYKKLTQTINNMNYVFAKLRNGEGTLGKLITDEKLFNDLETASEGLKNIIANIKQGKGTLGKLYKDDSLYIEAKKTLRSINRAAQGIEEQVPISVLGTIVGTAMK